MEESKFELGIWGSVTRSTEEEFKQFRKMLDNVIITPDKLNNFISEQISKQKEKK